MSAGIFSCQLCRLALGNPLPFPCTLPRPSKKDPLLNSNNWQLESHCQVNAETADEAKKKLLKTMDEKDGWAVPWPPKDSNLPVDVARTSFVIVFKGNWWKLRSLVIAGLVMFG